MDQSRKKSLKIASPNKITLFIKFARDRLYAKTTKLILISNSHPLGFM